MTPMVEVRADGKDVVVRLDSKTSVKRHAYLFTHTLSGEGVAVIVAHHFGKLLRDCVSKAREQAYNDGWSDAKSKRRKKRFFSPVL